MKDIKKRWMLPEGIDEALPPTARVLENWRRQLIDLYASWGYQLCMPPVVESLESLLSGSGAELEQQTFKVVDPLTGQLLGIRADITPQAARIDAHRMNVSGVNRLAYVSSVLRAKVDGLAGRMPLQAGCECFGSDAAAADIEAASLMVESLYSLGFDKPVLDLGHVGIYRQLLAGLSLTDAEQTLFFDMLKRKAIPEIQDFVTAHNASDAIKQVLSALPYWVGGEPVLEQAKIMLSDADIDTSALDKLTAVGAALQSRYPTLSINYDLSELRGYSYHTGLIFAAYISGVGTEVARGGRYDHIGEAFGRSRAATGFSLDLRALVIAANIQQAAPEAIIAPVDDCTELFKLIQTLRLEGKTVLTDLDGDASGSQRIEKINNQWKVVGA